MLLKTASVNSCKINGRLKAGVKVARSYDKLDSAMRLDKKAHEGVA
jgi:hypothetical protein